MVLFRSFACLSYTSTVHKNFNQRLFVYCVFVELGQHGLELPSLENVKYVNPTLKLFQVFNNLYYEFTYYAYMIILASTTWLASALDQYKVYHRSLWICFFKNVFTSFYISHVLPYRALWCWVLTYSTTPLPCTSRRVRSTSIETIRSTNVSCRCWSWATHADSNNCDHFISRIRSVEPWK